MRRRVRVIVGRREIVNEPYNAVHFLEGCSPSGIEVEQEYAANDIPR